MKTSSLPAKALALACVLVAIPAIAEDNNDPVVTAVFSRSFNDYTRPVDADGTPVIQTYVIAKGGFAPGRSADESIDNVRFAGVVRVLGKFLAKDGYYPAKDPKKADVMFVVHWGKTLVANDGTGRSLMSDGIATFSNWQTMGGGVGADPGINLHTPRHMSPDVAGGVNRPAGFLPTGHKDAQYLPEVTAALAEEAVEQMVQGIYQIRFAEQMRYEANMHNANLLGYTDELKLRDNPSLYAGAGTSFQDLLADLESERYYVSLTAYDFQDALQNNHKKALWRTVTSIDAHGNRFDEKLIAMVDRASRYFGKDSGHLVRQFELTPRVDLGELKVLGIVSEVPSRE